MKEITILQIAETRDGWDVHIKLSGSFFVHVKKAYWERLAQKKEDVASLVKRSFEFLLEREPETSILKEFDLEVISKYFPEYEKEISL